jgi:N-acetylmuramoyl-L-alanine amidase
VNVTRHPATLGLVLLATLAGAQTNAQTGQQPVPPSAAPLVPQNTPAKALSVPVQGPLPLNRLTIVLDPAHGGIDGGSRIGDNLREKDVTLAFAFKLRSLLTARGFAVVLTRDADTPTQPGANGGPLTLDDRAGIANHAHPAACLLLHATGSGTGVHLYNSELDPTDGVPQTIPWLLAQAAWVPQSRQLSRQIATALTRSGVPLISSNASVRPVDSLTCPALVVELAPQSDDPESINFADYQQQVAQAIAGALLVWRDQVQPPIRLAPITPGSATTDGAQP